VAYCSARGNSLALRSATRQNKREAKRMDTMKEAKLESLTIMVTDFNDLLLGASVAMAKAKGARDSLASVYLSDKGDGYLMA
jgi:hypothetical protein